MHGWPLLSTNACRRETVPAALRTRRSKSSGARTMLLIVSTLTGGIVTGGSTIDWKVGANMGVSGRIPTDSGTNGDNNTTRVGAMKTLGRTMITGWMITRETVETPSTLTGNTLNPEVKKK